jgi:antitoxin MazE
MELQVGKWGNSLALRLPAQVVRKLRLHEGARIELQIHEGGKATLSAAPAFDKADYLAQVRALTRRMPEGEPVVRHMRDTDRY